MKTSGPPARTCGHTRSSWEYLPEGIGCTKDSRALHCHRKQIELIHLAAIDRGESILPAMAGITRSSIRLVAQRDQLPLDVAAACGPIGAGKKPKIIVESTILLNDDNNVLDFLRACWLSQPRSAAMLPPPHPRNPAT